MTLLAEELCAAALVNSHITQRSATDFTIFFLLFDNIPHET